MVMPIRAAQYSTCLQVTMTEYPETNVSAISPFYTNFSSVIMSAMYVFILKAYSFPADVSK